MGVYTRMNRFFEDVGGTNRVISSYFQASNCCFLIVWYQKKKATNLWPQPSVVQILFWKSKVFDLAPCGLSCLVDLYLDSDLYRLCGSLHGLDTFWARGLSWINKETTTTTTQLLIRWPINRSNRFSDFLRLDRLDRFGKIMKSIFSKFWKREFQFFSDFQNFFGFLKFREKCFFLYTSQISRLYVMCRCSLLVNIVRRRAEGPLFETDPTLREFT